MMLKAEWRKVWNRPVAGGLLILVCLVQVICVFIMVDPDTGSTAALYNRYGGVMDEEWREKVLEEYDRLWSRGTSDHAEETEGSSQELNIIQDVKRYTDFTGMTDDHVASLKQFLSADPGYDTGRVEIAYEKLRKTSEDGLLVFGVSPAAEGMTEQSMVNWAFVFFMLWFGITQVSAERTTGIDPILRVSRNGREKLFRVQFTVCQLSALLVWSAANAALAAALSFRTGWGIPGCLTQDFLFCASPFVWNEWQVMAVVLSGSLISGQVIAAVIFCLVRIGKNTLSGFILGAGVLILPLIFSMYHKAVWTALLLPCLMQNKWMWMNYREFRVGRFYFQPWQIAAAELIAMIFMVGMWMRSRRKRNVSI